MLVILGLHCKGERIYHGPTFLVKPKLPLKLVFSLVFHSLLSLVLQIFFALGFVASEKGLNLQC